MYKNLSIALLLVVFGLIAGRSIAKSDSAVTSPVIVKRLALMNQNGQTSATLFTPSRSGLFRMSVYMVMTNGQASNYEFDMSWSDDAGDETNGPVVDLGGKNWSFSATSNGGPPGGVAVFEGVAGRPVIYSVVDNSGSGGTYSLYLVVERLI